MTTLDLHIGQLDIEAVDGEALSVRFDFPAAPSGEWSCHFGWQRGQSAALTADGAGLLLDLTGDDVAAALAHGTYRVRQDGADRIGGVFIAAQPQATPGMQTVEVVLADQQAVTVTTTDTTIDGGTP